MVKMVKCPYCSENLEKKEGEKKLCAQIGNPEIAIVQTKDPHFCNNCKEYFLTTSEIASLVIQIKSLTEKSKPQFLNPGSIRTYRPAKIMLRLRYKRK